MDDGELTDAQQAHILPTMNRTEVLLFSLHRSGAGGDNEVQRTMLQIVAELDGFSPRGNIKVLMATNRYARRHSSQHRSQKIYTNQHRSQKTIRQAVAAEISITEYSQGTRVSHIYQCGTAKLETSKLSEALFLQPNHTRHPTGLRTALRLKGRRNLSHTLTRGILPQYLQNWVDQDNDIRSATRKSRQGIDPLSAALVFGCSCIRTLLLRLLCMLTIPPREDRTRTSCERNGVLYFFVSYQRVFEKRLHSRFVRRPCVLDRLITTVYK